jgi:uncharacterized protein with HEPN domain
MNNHRRRGTIEDLVILDAICLRLASAIESLSRLTEARRQELFGNEWHIVWATRNRIAHAYMRLDAGIIVATLDQDIPQLIATLTEALEGE